MSIPCFHLVTLSPCHLVTSHSGLVPSPEARYSPRPHAAANGRAAAIGGGEVMRKWITRLRPSRAVAGKLAWAGCLLGVATLAFFWGRHGWLARAQAQGNPPVPQTA